MEYLFWIGLMVALVIVEASTANLICIWFAAGALAAVFAVLAGCEMFMQIAVFVIVSALALVFTKPLVKKLKTNQKTATNADMVIGKTGVVTEEISTDKFAGKVKVAGQEWSAVTEDGSFIPKNSKITVKSISGVKVVVEIVKFESTVSNV